MAAKNVSAAAKTVFAAEKTFFVAAKTVSLRTHEDSLCSRVDISQGRKDSLRGYEDSLRSSRLLRVFPATNTVVAGLGIVFTAAKTVLAFFAEAKTASSRRGGTGTQGESKRCAPAPITSDESRSAP